MCEKYVGLFEPQTGIHPHFMKENLYLSAYLQRQKWLFTATSGENFPLHLMQGPRLVPVLYNTVVQADQRQ